MKDWLITPRDPLIFRDGRPFVATPGERANSLPFPFPSTVIGAVRTRAGTDAASGRFDPDKLDSLLKKFICGPVLVELDADGGIRERYFPAAADALVVEASDKGKIRRYALAPIRVSADATDFGMPHLVGRDPQVKDKPHHKAPRFWTWSMMKKWLQHAADDGPFEPETLGMEELVRDHRTHVSIDPATQAARDGALFQTSGMEFTSKQARSLAIGLTSDADLQAGVDFLGGERRVVQWQATSHVFADAACLDDIAQAIMADKSCRLVLATPAHFTNGHMPSYLKTEFGAEVVASAVPRYQTISGWDYSKPNGGEPKPTRRLAPAGSVYFLDLTQVTDIKRFIERVWLKNISDDAQARRDGFGLALLGTWKNMEANQ
jgi:CRISPR-associated protein Cmr3